MRQDSPTGGALGNVTVQELTRLESVLGSLKIGQDDDQLIKNLNDLRSTLLQMRAARRQAFKEEFGESFAPEARSNLEDMSDDELKRRLGIN